MVGDVAFADVFRCFSTYSKAHPKKNLDSTLPLFCLFDQFILDLKFCSVSVQPMNYNGRMLSPAKNWVLTIVRTFVRATHSKDEKIHQVFTEKYCKIAILVSF